uniref:Uncharacterized protein n=1 Tax=Plectus sambesii TaxID=2011161 RepID=A0A914X962_9BILA
MDQKSAFDAIPCIDLHFSQVPVVDLPVIAALWAVKRPYSAQGSNPQAVQQTVVETNGLLELVVQALETEDVETAWGYLEWVMQANAMMMHKTTMIYQEQVLSQLGVQDPMAIMPSFHQIKKREDLMYATTLLASASPLCKHPQKHTAMGTRVVATSTLTTASAPYSSSLLIN